MESASCTIISSCVRSSLGTVAKVTVNQQQHTAFLPSSFAFSFLHSSHGATLSLFALDFYKHKTHRIPHKSISNKYLIIQHQNSFIHTATPVFQSFSTATATAPAPSVTKVSSPHSHSNIIYQHVAPLPKILTEENSQPHLVMNLEDSFNDSHQQSHPQLARLGCIGGGKMSQAIISGLVKQRQMKYLDKDEVIDLENLRVSYPSASCDNSFFRKHGIYPTTANMDVVQNSDVIILAVKPYLAQTVIQEVAHEIDPARHLIISVCAGITIAQLQKWLPNTTPIVRVMTNTPCSVSEGVSAFALSQHVTDQHSLLVETIFSAIGQTHKVQEKHLNTITGLAGSGPAYVFMFIEALIDAAVYKGLDRALATKIATQMVYGSAKMAKEATMDSVHMAQLRNNVESPGGTTTTATRALEKGNFRAVVGDAVIAATERAEQL